MVDSSRGLNMRLLLGRTFLGMGDWVMFTNILLMVNRQRPDVEIDLVAHASIPMRLLSLPLECGVRARIVPCGTNPNLYDAHIPHVIYDSPRPPSGEHLLASMLRCFNQKTGLKLEMDWGAKAVPCTNSALAVPEGKYILMPSTGAQTSISAPKAYGGMGELANLISRSFGPVIQVGSPGDPPLSCAKARYQTLPWSDLYKLFRGASFGVFIENGLSHWAAQCDMKWVTLFCSPVHASPSNVAYPGMSPVMVRNRNPSQVMEEIRPLLRQVWGESPA